ncbi:hypothetical protein [Glutamicibacter sp.]|uniref:hypothetical protein n=1 Tax=Glutamicibacter sp. TaxID=1931995 RepID=UPI002B4663A3|nr:hypothetical protein [Glutamicibacter sp.]HJX77318.1 hypothetical protein [Glutamicibacter sp.]
MNTFNSVDKTRQLQVKELGKHFTLGIEYKDAGRSGLTLHSFDAPAIALAVLEVAGYGDTSDDMSVPEVLAFNAMHKLQEVVDVQERITAKAKEQAELEEHAAELERVYRTCPSNKNAFVEIALKARELSKEAGE